MKERFISHLIIFSTLLIGNNLSAQWVTNHNPIFMTNVTKPSVYTTYSDPKFGTTVERITDCIAQGYNGIVPQYSKRQAWNSDESKLLLFSGDGEALLCDGNDYSFIKALSGVSGEDVFWHSTDPNTLYYNADSILYSYNTTTDIAAELHAFTAYTWANTRGEGNMSLDGRYYAVVGQQYNYISGNVVFKDIVVYDLQANSEISVMPIPQDSISGFDWTSISPLGNYVVVDYADETTGRYHGVEVYDRNMNFIWQKPLGAGHSDLGIDANNDEVLVMDVYNADSNKTYIKKFRLSDGQETTLLEVSELFDLHISLRNQQRHDWCFISTFDYTGRLTDDSLSWLPFEDEVFALKLDGSGDVQRIAHHHSRRYSPSTYDPDHSNYWAEPHATVDRQGTRIIYGSNWRQNMELMNSVDVYLVDFENFVGLNDIKTPEERIIIYPNPAQDKAFIKLDINEENEIDLVIYDTSGKEILAVTCKVNAANNNLFEINLSSFPQGIYLCKVIASEKSYSKLFEKVW